MSRTGAKAATKRRHKRIRHVFNQLVDILRAHPEIALFGVLALGYAFGQIRFGPIQLGGVCGTLIVALLVGQLDVTLAEA